MSTRKTKTISDRLAGALLASILLLSLHPAIATAEQIVAPDDSAIRYVGRFTDDYRFSWTGCEIQTKYRGSSIRADLQEVAAAPAGLTVVVNGEPRFLKVGGERKVYTLAEDLDPDRVHRISIIKRSEASKGTVRFYGFVLPEGGELIRPETPTRKLLVIGDSITCGYGNEADDPSEANSVENENGYMSYAMIAARALDADAVLVCWSGRGMFRNRSKQDDQSGTLPKLFDQILPHDADSQLDHSQFVPDVIIINLGTNDSAEHSGAKLPLPKDGFIHAYTAFLKRLREIAPDSKLVLSIGPMQSGPVAGWLPEIAAQFEDASVVIFDKYAGKEDIGAHWHPSVTKNQKMAEQLVGTIRSVTGWISSPTH